MDDAELEQSLDLDDSFEVKQVLAQSDSGRTELVVSKDENYGLLVRKYIARELANPDAWSAASKAFSVSGDRANTISVSWVARG